MADRGCVLAGAKREWLEETGIDLERLRLLPSHHVDDGQIGVRLLVAVCQTGAGPDGVPDTGEGGECCWLPPDEDEADDDPVVLSHWMLASKVLENRYGLTDARKQLLEKALDILRSELKAVGPDTT